ncbi:MAG TPA: right-handed parallel beta-helix repeat-containing protein [Chloroflexota bacterium]|nr:right-handed parallel beta-helix repeat-containing protein [Chloroflexota bacterium]
MEVARRVLCDVVAEHGPTLATDARRLRYILNDLCPDDRKAVFALSAAVEARVTAELAASTRATALRVERAGRRLADELGLAEDVARWAVESWAIALGYAGGDGGGHGGGNGTGQGDHRAALVVCAQGRGDLASLAQALREAPPWSRIEVLPGVYAEPLVVDRPVEIVAVGKPGEVVAAGGVRLAAEYALVRGMGLDAGAAPDGGPQTLFGVDVPRGELFLEDCDVSGAELACVAVRGRAASATLRRCRVRHGRQAGVYVSLGGASALWECEISENGGAGVEIGWQGSPALHRCRITGNGTYGIRIYAGGESQVEECELTGNRLGAWSVEDPVAE